MESLASLIDSLTKTCSTNEDVLDQARALIDTLDADAAVDAICALLDWTRMDTLGPEEAAPILVGVLLPRHRCRRIATCYRMQRPRLPSRRGESGRDPRRQPVGRLQPVPKPDEGNAARARSIITAVCSTRRGR